MVNGILNEIDNEAKTITLQLGEQTDDSWTPELDREGDQLYEEIDLPEGTTVDPRHLGTYYELRVIDGVLDPTHELD
jgi:hypothetical protein